MASGGQPRNGTAANGSSAASVTGPATSGVIGSRTRRWGDGAGPPGRGRGMGDAAGIPEHEGTLAAGAEQGPMPWPDAVTVGVQIGEALASTHRAGLVHGNITPDAIVVSASGEADLSDAGVGPTTGPARIAHSAP